MNQTRSHMPAGHISGRMAAWKAQGHSRNKEGKLSEKDFILFHHIVLTAEVLLYAACLAAFLRPFMGGRSRDHGLRRKLFLTFLIYSAVSLLGMRLPGNGGLYMMLTIALLLACAGFLEIDRRFLLLLCVLFFCIRNLSMTILRSAEYFSSDLFLAGSDTPEKIFLSATVSHILVTTLQLLLFSLMLLAARRQLGKRGLELHIRELCCLLLMPAAGILFANISIRLLIVPWNGSIFRLFEQIPAALWILPSMAALFYLAILSTIASFQKIIALQEARNMQMLEEEQLRAIRGRMAQMEQIYDGMHRMRHELRGHLANLKGLAERCHYQDMDLYIASMGENMHMFGPDIHTGNAVMDVIISDAQEEAVRQGTEFQWQFRYPASDGYDAYDIGIILNNLLRNALEACRRMTEGKRHVSLSGKRKKKFFLIEVRNPFYGEIRFDRHTQLPVSTKEPSREMALGPSLHGIGLSNVKREAEKYRGNLDIRIDGQEFIATVILQERPNGTREPQKARGPSPEI